MLQYVGFEVLLPPRDSNYVLICKGEGFCLPRPSISQWTSCVIDTR